MIKFYLKQGRDSPKKKRRIFVKNEIVISPKVILIFSYYKRYKISNIIDNKQCETKDSMKFISKCLTGESIQVMNIILNTLYYKVRAKNPLEASLTTKIKLFQKFISKIIYG